jgi:hypothetical protein
MIDYSILLLLMNLENLYYMLRILDFENGKYFINMYEEY